MEKPVIKICTKCIMVKGVQHYNKRIASKDGLTSQCTQCLNTKAMKVRAKTPEVTRERNLQTRFNMSISQYNDIFLKQKGRCVICFKAESTRDKNNNVKWLSVDHNHKTGEVRGLLCNSCNTGIGKLGDSTKVLQSAITYLNERGSYGK